MGLFDKSPKQTLTGSFRAAGHKLQCPACGNDKFESRDVLLNTPAMTFFGFDWANRTATALICTHCTRIEWFLNKPELYYS